MLKHPLAVALCAALAVSALPVFAQSTSAGVGGADTIAVLPYTQALGLPDAFARRVARNTQLVLLERMWPGGNRRWHSPWLFCHTQRHIRSTLATHWG